MKVVTGVKGLFAAAMVAAGLVAFAEPEVEITKAWQTTPGSGKIDFTYEVRDVGGVAYDLIVCVEAKGCEKTFTFTNENVSAGSTTTSIDYKTKLGKVSPNVSIYASLVKHRLGGIQLWAGGPIWADCNVGATKPEDYGYYFWWGDTVGYVHDGSKWVAATNSASSIEFSVGQSPANSSCQNPIQLLNGGWVDGTAYKLLPQYDAATAILGESWRMPTGAEFTALIENTNQEWVENWNGTGKNGYVITGKTGYSDKSIFLPAAHMAENSSFTDGGTSGYFWSSSLGDESYSNTDSANTLYFTHDKSGSGTFVLSGNFRYYGGTIRAVKVAE